MKAKQIKNFKSRKHYEVKYFMNNLCVYVYIYMYMHSTYTSLEHLYIYIIHTYIHVYKCLHLQRVLLGCIMYQYKAND